jgi:MoxR-like ATPase
LEAIDLLGHLIPMGGADKTFVWKDGPLSEAFRKASKGEKVVFLIDELLRAPQRELAILLTALSPFEGRYFLRTGRVVSVEDGVAQEETLMAPIDNLAIVATTNVSHFVEECDPALRERFIVTYKDMTEAELKPILIATAKARGMDAEVIEPLLKFFKVGRKAQVEGLLLEGPSARTLCRAIEHSQSKDEIQDWLLDQALLWVRRDLDGAPNQEQLDQCRTLIHKCFDRA